MLNQVNPDRRVPMKNHLKTLFKLGITDINGVPNPQMLMACKVLKIDLNDLEPIPMEEFITKKRKEIISKHGEDGLQLHNVQQLAKTEFHYHQRWRQSKI